jgi:TonB-dependent starch-binding outer membrane protein SusC
MNRTYRVMLRAGLQSTFLLLLALLGFSQSRTISGKVTGHGNSPVAGVSVTVKGSPGGTVTDEEGNFTLQVPEGARTLTFSSVGYDAQDVSLGSSNTLDVRLSNAGQSLQDVVVIGYGTQKRAEVTASVATVKFEDFNVGGARSPLDLIQGKVAGLSITRTQGNNPNSSAAIQLRGVTSLTGTITPLIVIDGIPGGNLDLLQQDDIESFDVLKDGSAAAIYGTRGNAGVILITTKKGRAGEPRYEYSNYFQREYIAKKPDFLTADEYRKLVNPTNDLKGNTDLYEMLIDKKNLSQYHTLAASGGTATTNYRASMYYNYAEGIAIKNNRRQYGGRVNINQRGFQNRLQMQMNLAANLNKANRLGGSEGDFEQSVQRNPTAPVVNPDGTFIETSAFNNYNPLARLQQEVNERDQQTFSGDARLTLEVLKGLKVSAFGALVRNMLNDRAYRSRASRSSVRDFQGGGFASKSNTLNIDQTFESTIDYNTILADDHSLNAVAGYSYQYSTDEGFNVNNNGFLTDVFQDYNLGAGNAVSNILLPRPGLGSSKSDNTLIAFFGRISYAFQQKYLAQVILRHEGSSRFGANHKWGNFPAASIGWVISREDFMQNFPVVNNLKLRAGYGVTGNQGIPNYQSLVTLSTGGAYLQNGVWFQTYGPSRNPNPDLKWEKKGEYNVGLDFSVLQNRISGAIDVYRRNTVDLLANYTAQQPAYINSTIYTNVGAISNKGIEVLLSGSPLRSKDFSWNIDLTWNKQSNKLESLSNDIYKSTFLTFGGLPSPGNLGPAIRTVEGGPLGNFYGKRFAGLNSDGKFLFYKADKTTGTAGQMTDNDLTVIGNGVPKYMASLSNAFVYKNFDLVIFLRGKFGFDILNTQDLYFGNKKWLPNNLLRSAITKHNMLNDDPQYSDYYLEKGDFVKLDNVTLAYNFKFNNVAVRTLRIYASGRNMLTFTKYSGLDPELQDTGLTTGIDNRGFYPRTRSFTLGLNLGF